jgi:hypothetical protein
LKGGGDRLSHLHQAASSDVPKRQAVRDSHDLSLGHLQQNEKREKKKLKKKKDKKGRKKKKEKRPERGKC